MKFKYLIIILLSVLFSCERNDENSVLTVPNENNIESKLIGRWNDKSSNCKDTNFQYPAYLFRGDGTGYISKFSCETGKTKHNCSLPYTVLSFKWEDKDTYVNLTYSVIRDKCTAVTPTKDSKLPKESVPYSIYGNTIVIKGKNYNK